MMVKQLEFEALSAELSTLESMLAGSHPDDYVGRLSLGARRADVVQALEGLRAANDNLASTALMFGGAPVLGSNGIDAEFAARALNDFKDIVDVLWASSDNQQLKSRGPVPDHGSAKLFITQMVRGSVGFLIEELDPKGSLLFPSSLKRATDRAAELMEAFAAEGEDAFTRELELLSPRVFSSLRHFITGIHRASATMRLVEGDKDLRLTKEAVDRAFVRIEESAVEEDDVELEGTLLGVLPEAGRFEFTSSAGMFLTGKVAETFAESYLKGLRDEQIIGRTWLVSFHRKQTRQFGRQTTSYLLFDLHEVL